MLKFPGKLKVLETEKEVITKKEVLAEIFKL